MSRYEKDKLTYITMCVFLFAKRLGIDAQTAMSYLLENSGISHLDKHYEAEHTLPIEDTLDAVTAICQRNGGVLA